MCHFSHAAFSHFCESLVYYHWGSESAVCVSCCSAPPSNPLTPLCDGDQDAAAPVDEEALWGAAVLSLHADIGRTMLISALFLETVTCWMISFWLFERCFWTATIVNYCVVLYVNRLIILAIECKNILQMSVICFLMPSKCLQNPQICSLPSYVKEKHKIITF